MDNFVDNSRTSEFHAEFPVKKKFLLIFAKQPITGKVKTRLTPPLSPSLAAELYAAMLSDTMTNAANPGLHRCLFVDPPSAVPFFRELWPSCTIMVQEGETLGQRLLNAFSWAFVKGADAVAAIGTDSPDLPPGFITNAFDLLNDENGTAVFGPAEDGGYYMIGMNRLYPDLFRDISWSSPEVLAESLERALNAGIRVCQLDLWSDLDTWQDVQAFISRNENSATASGTTALLTKIVSELNGHEK